MSLENQIKQLFDANGTERPEKPKLPTVTEGDLMAHLITEGLMGLNDALDNDNLVEIATTLTSLAYIVAMTSVAQGIPLDALLQEAHKMTMKGEDFDSTDILMDHLFPDIPKALNDAATSFQEHIQ